MKNNFIIITLLFFILFSFILSFFTSVSGFSFEYDNVTYDFGDIDLYEYTVAIPSFYNGNLASFFIYTFKEEPFIKSYTNNSKNLFGLFPKSSTSEFIRYLRVSSFEGVGFSSKVEYSNYYENYALISKDSLMNSLYCNFNIKDDKGNIVFYEKLPFTKPFIVNKEEVKTGKFNNVVINAGDYKLPTDEVYLLSYYYSNNVDDNLGGLYPRKEIMLKYNCDYYVGASNERYVYEVPMSNLGIDLKEGNKYGFKLAVKNAEGNFEYLDTLDFNIGVVTKEDKEQADRDKDLALKEEQNKTNKGIWDTIKDIVSFLNPFSENFFVYKLIELLVNAIKGLFLPSSDFINNWINNMNDWLSKRLGALYYPVDIVVEFLNRVANLNESGTAVISGDGFEFMGAKVIPAFSYDLNSLLTNDTLKNIHNIYLTVVDVIFYLCLVLLAKNTFVDIFGGKYDDFSDIAETGFSADSSYRQYSRYQSNKKRYQRENGGRRR